jgi:hypothetical protein
MKEIEFEREQIVTRIVVPGSLATDKYIDYFTNDLHLQLSVFVATSMKQEREVEYTFYAPTFKEWLFKKKRTAKFIVSSKDVLLDPPVTQERSIRFFEFNPIELHKGINHE